MENQNPKCKILNVKTKIISIWLSVGPQLKGNQYPVEEQRHILIRPYEWEDFGEVTASQLPVDLRNWHQQLASTFGVKQCSGC